MAVVQLREATKADFPVLRDLFRIGDQYHRDLEIGVLRSDYIEYTAFDLQQAFDKGDVIFVASTENEITGIIRIGKVAVEQGRLMAGRRYAIVHEIVVAEHARGCGVGCALIDRAKAWATNEGLTTLELSVFAINNGARAFYNRLGFEEQQTRLQIGLKSNP